MEEIGRDNWLSFISSKRPTVYHHPAWHRTIELTYDIRPAYVVMADSSGVMKAAVPGAVVRGLTGSKRFVSFPFSDTCGPLADSLGEMSLLANALCSVTMVEGKDWSGTELRTALPLEPESFSVYRGYTGHVLRLGRHIDDIFSSFHKDCVQRRIKKAFRAGLSVGEGTTIGDIKDFYALHLMTRKKLGAPVQPFSFFRNLWNTLSPEGLLTVLLVKKGATPIAGIVLLKYAKRAIYKFGASDERYLGLGGNQLAMWTAIRKASDEGFNEFDFGRSFSDNGKLNEYKARWGAEEFGLHYLYSPFKEPGFKDEGGRCAHLASSVFKSLPRLSNRFLGRLFYKYLA